MERSKIGIGIITCNREDFLLDLLVSFAEQRDKVYDEIIVVNDGKKLSANATDFLEYNGILFVENKTNLGVGKTKNIALRYLRDKQCDDIFILEDDVVIKDFTVFSKYIELKNLSGIQHLNYGPGSPFNRVQTQSFDLGNRHELSQESPPNPRLVVGYSKDVEAVLYQHCVGMFSYFTKKVLDEVGYIDEDYLNAWEHVDHTYRIIKKGMHPPFWWFADIKDSDKYLGEQKDAISKSAIAKDNKEWLNNVNIGRELYLMKHGHYPNMPPFVPDSEVIESLKSIQSKWKI